MSNEKNIKGYNYGYELAKLDPKLTKTILSSIQSSSNETLSYFKEGVKQHHREKIIELKKAQNRDKSKDRDKDRSR